jgi:hypothetical protein
MHSPQTSKVKEQSDSDDAIATSLGFEQKVYAHGVVLVVVKHIFPLAPILALMLLMLFVQ